MHRSAHSILTGQKAQGVQSRPVPLVSDNFVSKCLSLPSTGNPISNHVKHTFLDIIVLEVAGYGNAFRKASRIAKIYKLAREFGMYSSLVLRVHCICCWSLNLCFYLSCLVPRSGAKLDAAAFDVFN